MISTATASRTETTTMTEPRVRAVMQKVSANLAAFVVADLLDRDRAIKWADDLIYLQVEEALNLFEIQITTPDGRRFGLRYTVSSDGSLQQDSKSGGIDLYGLPAGCRVGLFADVLPGASAAVWEGLRQRGWGTNGSRLDATESSQRGFSSDGYGLSRSHVGTWP